MTHQQLGTGRRGRAEGESDTADWVTAAAVVALVVAFLVACWISGAML